MTVKKVETKVKSMVKTIEKSKGGPSLSMALDKLGAQSLKAAKRSHQTMQEASMKVLPDLDSKSPLAQTIIDANTEMVALNPHTVTGSFLYKIPFPGLKKTLLKSYITNFQSQNEQVQGIFEALENGKDQLLIKMISLQDQYNELRTTDDDLVNDIEVCKKLLEHIESIDREELSQPEQMKYQTAQNKVQRRIRDLTTIRSAIQQFFVSINQTMENQDLLNETIDSILAVGPIVLHNAIMVHDVISKQKQVADAARKTQSTIAAGLEQNASMIEDNATNVAEMYNNPVIAIETFQKSYDKLRNAVNITQTAMIESTANAKQMTADLENMQAGFKDVELQLEESVKSNKAAKG